MAAAGTCGTGTRSTGSIVAAASTNNVTSFQRRGPRASGADSGSSRLVSIAGTRPSVRNGQLLVSTGLPALDQLLEIFNNQCGFSYQAGPVSSSRFGHYYDISKRIPQELIETSKWHGFFLPEKISSTFNVEPCSLTSGYVKLLQFIQNIIYEEGFDGSNPQKKQKNILRIGIQNLGSPLWGDDICCTENCDTSHSLTKFLYILRGLLRTSLSACIITIPTHLIQNKAVIARVTNLSDTVVGLESFIGSEKETNPLYKDYHGLIHIRQIPRLNNLIYDISDVKDLAFKLKKKLFTIEQLIVNQAASSSSRSSLQECWKFLIWGYSLQKPLKAKRRRV
ncbi:hypothetical protein FD754_017483 [Muntiacus muntjak]|uniref:Elongator complex protein 4 n=1 Tax=Muntiacus muntjak TaxID=9888 RepID=A0A5N3VX02_MUNMU|nr:hypothetical protein FD754_017483 [Muntiacus muntjak]